MVARILSFLAWAGLSTAAAVGRKCSIQFEGRVPAGSTPADFDASTSLYNTGFVKGANLTWSQIIQLPAAPAVPLSLFDRAKSTSSVEVTISDHSIFAPSSTNVQLGFRRAELLPVSNSGTDNSTVGIRTLHFSLRKDAARPLNTSHEYQLVFLESADYSTNQFVLKTGTIIGGPANQDPNALVLQSNVKNPMTLFTVPFKSKTWQNFGLVLDFTRKTTQVLYSENTSPLKAATAALANDISGQGQFHFGVLKKPTGEGLTDITRQGFQPSNIDEGVIYGGIFQEKSDCGCISYS